MFKHNVEGLREGSLKCGYGLSTCWHLCFQVICRWKRSVQVSQDSSCVLSQHLVLQPEVEYINRLTAGWKPQRYVIRAS